MSAFTLEKYTRLETDPLHKRSRAAFRRPLAGRLCASDSGGSPPGGPGCRAGRSAQAGGQCPPPRHYGARRGQDKPVGSREKSRSCPRQQLLHPPVISKPWPHLPRPRSLVSVWPGPEGRLVQAPRVAPETHPSRQRRPRLRHGAASTACRDTTSSGGGTAAAVGRASLAWTAGCSRGSRAPGGRPPSECPAPPGSSHATPAGDMEPGGVPAAHVWSVPAHPPWGSLRRLLVSGPGWPG